MTPQQDVFQPLTNFFKSGVLIIFSPLRFFKDFNFLHGSWQRALGFGLGFKVLTAAIYMLAIEALLLTPFMQGLQDIKLPEDELFQSPWWEMISQWLHFPSGTSILAVPLSHIPSVLFWAAVLWASSQISRSGFSFKASFNFINLFAPFSLFYALVFGMAVLFLNSLQTFLIMVVIAGALFLLSLFFMTRTFHYGAKEIMVDTLARDPKALNRFYAVLTVIMALPCFLIVAAAWVLRIMIA